MPLKPYYAQKCPACRKASSFHVDLLGFEVSCIHCGKRYQARDEDQQSAAIEDPLNFWIHFTQHGIDETNSKPPPHYKHPK